MDIVVLVKQVPDTESMVQIAGDGVSIKKDDIKWVMNPYDELAVEEALRIKDKPVESVLLERMLSRQADTSESVELRLATFHQEMLRIDEFDYVVPNRTGQLERTVEVIQAIIEAEQFIAMTAGPQVQGVGKGLEA